MKDQGILFKAEMVRAILAGKKEVTRRIVKFPECPCGCKQFAEFDGTGEEGALVFASRGDQPTGTEKIRCRYKTGQTLWVRETWAALDGYFRGIPLTVKQAEFPSDVKVSYRADHRDTAHSDGPDKLGWRPSLLMPRWASRINLTCLSVRAEHLRMIDDDDARLEGVDNGPGLGGHLYPSPHSARGPLGYRANYARLWDTMHGKTHPWKANPIVWRIAFTVQK